MAMINASHLPAMAQEELAELTRLNKELRTEKEAAVKRAAKRHKDMMHANRRAERAEQALAKEAQERHNDQIKATILFSAFKETIKALETGIVQAQQAGPSDERVLAIEAANTSLQATLVEQKKQADQRHASAEATIQELRAGAEADRMRIEEEAAQHYGRLLTVREKKLRDELSGKAQAKIAHMQEAHKAESENLKLRLQQAHQTLEWQKKQTQQQTAHRIGLQNQQMVAGVHAGFPLSTQQSPGQLKEVPNKRRKYDSVGSVYSGHMHEQQANIHSNASIPTPERQRSRGNSTRPGAPATTPKRKAQTAFREQKQPTKQPMTPTRQTAIHRQQQRPNMHASPLQRSHQSHREMQSLPSHLQDTPQAQQLFSSFFQQMNARRQHDGQTRLSPQEALPLFNQWFAQRVNQLKAAQSTQNTVRQPTFEHDGSPGWMFSQEEGSRNGLQSPSMPTGTALSQQTFTPSNTLPTSWGQTAGATHVQNMQQTHAQHQQQQRSQESLQSTQQPPSVFDQGPGSTLSHEATPAVIFTNNAITHMHATSPRTNEGSLESDEGQLALQLQTARMYPSPEDSQGLQDTGGDSSQAQLQEWGSPAPKDEGASFNMDSAQPAPGITNPQNFGEDFNFGDFPTMTGVAMPSTLHQSQLLPNEWIDQRDPSVQQQQRPQDYGIDPALFFNHAAVGPIGDFINEHSSNQYGSTPVQHSMTGTPTPFIPPPKQSQPQHPTASRKRPAPPSSARSTPAPSTRSGPAPTVPPIATCLHCHENWWNESCDAGEPCQNCVGSHALCERPSCLNFAAGTCTIARCPRVHEGDMRYRNVVTRPKTLKRIGKKGDQRVSPSVLAHQQGQGQGQMW